jgi:hypothetical protein
MSEEGSFSEERWVRIMADYCADGVWHRDGCADDADELPVSKELVARIRAWQAQYDYEAPTGDERSGDWDVEGFAQEGLAIARAVKAELPHFTVIYFDEHRIRLSPPPGPRSAFEYEIT